MISRLLHWLAQRICRHKPQYVCLEPSGLVKRRCYRCDKVTWGT